MFQSLSFLYTSSAILLSILAIYSIICEIQIGVTIHKLKGAEGSADAEKTVTEHTRFNIYMWLARKLSKGNSSKLKRKTKSTFAIVLVMIYIFIRSALISFFIAQGFMTLDNAFNALPSILYNITNKHEDCECYAKCTGDPEDDKKTAYELIFGPTEYEKLVNDMLYTCTAKEKEEFEEINAGDDGAAKSQFIQAHINDQMVADYKSLVGQNRRFKSNDGKHRYEMNDDELRDDLIQLFKDVKTNGRNLQCPHCSSINSSYLYLQCEGMKHWKPGWSWDDLWTDPDEPPTPGGAHNPPGNATGKYAVELEDGTHWYWYHQNSSCGANCGYNVIDPTYGNLWSLTIGGEGGNNNTMAGAGCSIYSTAMAMSNLLDEEYTPYRVIQELMGCTISDGGGTYIFQPRTDANGIGRQSDGMHYDYAKMAELINAKFGSMGMHAESKAFTQANVDECIASSDHYGMVINSWTGGFSWYSGTGHFMVIRKKGSDGKYYCLSSSGSTAYGYTDSGIKRLMSTGCDYDTVASFIKHSSCLYITMDKSYYEQGGGGEGSGSLLGIKPVEGYQVDVWKPDNINSSTGIILCMPGNGTTSQSYSNYHAYLTVKNGQVKPANAVVFAFYDAGNYSIDPTAAQKIITKLKETDLNGVGDKLYYYGFSQGAWLYGDKGFYNMGFSEVILGDGGDSHNIRLGSVTRALVTQSAPGGHDPSNESIVGADAWIPYYNNVFSGLGSNYTLVDMRTYGVTDHLTASAYTAANKSEVFTSFGYAMGSLPEPKYGLTWFTGGSAGGGGGGGDYDFTASDQEMIDLFKSLGYTQRKSEGLTACFKACTEQGMTAHEAIGLISCATCEGEPGLVQYSFPTSSALSRDTSGLLHKSTQSNPLHIDSLAKRNALAAIQSNGDSMGIGTAQWTNGRCADYLSEMQSHFGTQANYSESDLFNFDYHMYIHELGPGGSYHPLINNIKNHNSSLEAIVVYSMFYYEAGFGNYKNTDVIQDYYDATKEGGGWKYKYLTMRYNNAQAIDAAFRAKFGDGGGGGGGNNGTTITANMSDLRPFVKAMYQSYGSQPWRYNTIPALQSDKTVTNTGRKLSDYNACGWVCDTTSSRIAYLLGETNLNNGAAFTNATRDEAALLNISNTKHAVGSLGDYWLVESGDPNISIRDLKPGDIIIWDGKHAATVVYNSGTEVRCVHAGGHDGIAQEYENGCTNGKITGSLYTYCSSWWSGYNYIYVFRSNKL